MDLLTVKAKVTSLPIFLPRPGAVLATRARAQLAACRARVRMSRGCSVMCVLMFVLFRPVANNPKVVSGTQLTYLRHSSGAGRTTLVTCEPSALLHTAPCPGSSGHFQVAEAGHIMDNVIVTISVYTGMVCAVYYVCVIVNECMRDERKW